MLLSKKIDNNELDNYLDNEAYNKNNFQNEYDFDQIMSLLKEETQIIQPNR